MTAGVLLGLVLRIAPVRGAEPPVLDLHCHVAGIGAGRSGCFVSEAMRRSWKLRPYLRAFGVSRAELEREGDGLVVRRLAERLAGSARVRGAVVLALDGVWRADGTFDRDATEVCVPNAFVREAIRPYPELRFGCSVHPSRPDAVAELERQAAAGAVLCKWLPNIQLMDMTSPDCDAFYRALVRLRLPLLVHTGTEHSFTRSDDALGDPARLERALAAGVTVIAAHGGGAGRTDGERNMDRLLALLPKYPHLFVDVSALTLLNHAGHLRALLRRPNVAGRLVYGSDYPLIETAITSPLYSSLTIGPARAWRLWRTRNPWDRDVGYLEALGVPAEVFARSAALLSRPAPGAGRATPPRP